MDMIETRNRIRTNSDLVIQHLGPHSGIAFGLDRASLEWLDGFLERQRKRPDLTDELRGTLVNQIGSFLGECIAANTKGDWKWIESQQTLGVQFSIGNCVFPFNKVMKQLDNGRAGGDSILGLYDSVLALIAAGKL